MGDLKKGQQQGDGRSAGLNPNPDAGGESDNDGAEFGTSERATRGTNRDFDESGESINQGHGHPREERNQD